MIEHPPTSAVVVAGMPRSGSTRLINMIAEGMTQAFGAPAVTPHWPVVPAEIESSQRSGRPYLGKAHDFTDDVLRKLSDGSVRTLVTWRDPYDSAVSAAHMFAERPVDAVASVARSLHSALTLPPAAMSLVSYEMACSEEPGDVAALLGLAGLSLPAETVREIGEHWSREAAVRRSQHVEATADYGHDASTLLHPGHVGPARELAPADQEQIHRELQAQQVYDLLATLIVRSTATDADPEWQFGQLQRHLDRPQAATSPSTRQLAAALDRQLQG